MDYIVLIEVPEQYELAHMPLIDVEEFLLEGDYSVIDVEVGNG